jgi:hypothetical protein
MRDGKKRSWSGYITLDRYGHLMPGNEDFPSRRKPLGQAAGALLAQVDITSVLRH